MVLKWGSGIATQGKEGDGALTGPRDGATAHDPAGVAE